MFQPWLAHWYPGVTLPLLEAGYWSVSGYVAMHDSTKAAQG